MGAGSSHLETKSVVISEGSGEYEDLLHLPATVANSSLMRPSPLAGSPRLIRRVQCLPRPFPARRAQRSAFASFDASRFSCSIPNRAGVNGAIRRHKDFAAALKGSAFESVRTCRDAFLRGVAQSKDRPCFGYRSKIGTLEVRAEATCSGSLPLF